jgi:hypothetical protein
VYERSVLEAVSLLERAGIEAIVLKGVAAAAAYPARGVRVTGDIDLLVCPRRVDDAKRVLEGRTYAQYKLDFEHMETNEIPGMGYDALMARSRWIEVVGVPVRVLGREDHYRHLCLHFLGHYGFRPLWLCDIAAASEDLPATFDWGACLTADERVASWVLAATALACDLLGAKPAAPPASLESVPSWLRADILRCWGAGYVKGRQAERSPVVPIRSYLTATGLRRPWTIASALRERWRSRLEFTVDTRSAVERRPPFAPRVRAGLRRASESLGAEKGGSE